jgi:hypothetical protein
MNLPLLSLAPVAAQHDRLMTARTEPEPTDCRESAAMCGMLQDLPGTGTAGDGLHGAVADYQFRNCTNTRQ